MQQWENGGAGPIQINRFNKAWRSLHCEHVTSIRLSGTIGVSESRCAMMSIGDRTHREDVTKSQEGIGKDFNWTLTKQNAAFVVGVIETAIAEAKKNRPVKDERETQEAVTARNAQSLQYEEERKQKQQLERAKFVELYGTGETVTAVPGQMCLVAQLCYDNSDCQSDYFDRHATLSPAFALLVVSEQRKTESLARMAVGVSPLLKGVEFSWHVEQWSMGHGNYLESKGFEIPEELKGLRKVYGRAGDGVTQGHWEIKFCGKGEYPAFQGCRVLASSVPAEASAGGDGITVTENTARAGIEIRFAGRPADSMVSSLRLHGWRLARGGRCWYIKASDQARTFANELAAA